MARPVHLYGHRRAPSVPHHHIQREESVCRLDLHVGHQVQQAKRPVSTQHSTTQHSTVHQHHDVQREETVDRLDLHVRYEVLQAQSPVSAQHGTAQGWGHGATRCGTAQRAMSTRHRTQVFTGSVFCLEHITNKTHHSLTGVRLVYRLFPVPRWRCEQMH